MERKTKRVSLGELKRALDKIPIAELDTCFIMHPYGTETPDDDEITLVKWGDDWEEFFDKYDVQVINKFARAVEEDVLITQEVQKDIDKREDYLEDMEC